ncbi:MAG TPA: phytoene/squalene synthase family protein [Paraburkholderia sp.]|nr:phytoene/squalene synthase family protein [Paraburkholderia sp.]
MQNPSRAFLLGPLLKGVSRSFYLTLNVLPAGMRDPVGVAYLLARAADTIADTALIPPDQRLELLLSLRACVNGTAAANDDALRQIAGEVANQQTQSDEKVLLESLGAALSVLAQLDDADRKAVREIVTTLTEGMEYDLRTFPDERSGRVSALLTWDDLDRYTYLVAGCVGEFWTKMTYAHVPGALKGDPATLMRDGVRFGKALQMVNVLRDCGKDLRIGRCYLPETMLHQAGLRAEDLLAPDASRRARTLMVDLVRRTLDHFRAAIDYTFALPAWSLRLRLACLWPILIGLDTLLLLVDNDDWLDPQKASKLKRGDVYRILVRSTLSAPSNRLLRAWFDERIMRIEARIAR